VHQVCWTRRCVYFELAATSKSWKVDPSFTLLISSEPIILIFRHVSQPTPTITARNGLLKRRYHCADIIKSLHRKTTYSLPNSRSRHKSVSAFYSPRAIHVPPPHTTTNRAKINSRRTIQRPNDSITRRESHSHTNRRWLRRRHHGQCRQSRGIYRCRGHLHITPTGIDPSNQRTKPWRRRCCRVQTNGTT